MTPGADRIHLKSWDFHLDHEDGVDGEDGEDDEDGVDDVDGGCDWVWI